MHARGANLRDRLRKWIFVVAVAGGTSVLERYGATRTSWNDDMRVCGTDLPDGLHKWAFAVAVAGSTSVLERPGATRASWNDDMHVRGANLPDALHKWSLVVVVAYWHERLGVFWRDTSVTER